MTLKSEQKAIMTLHTEYESMVKFFKFAKEKAESKELKQQFQFQLTMSESLLVVLELLLKFSEKLEEEKLKELQLT